MKKTYRHCSLDKVQEYTNNILDVLYSINHKESARFLAESKNWYKEAKKLCRQIAKNTGLSTKLVAGVVAVLSPNQSWDIQVKYTERFIYDILNGVSYKATGYGYFTNREKAANMILNKRVYPYLSGNKVESFYNNILGYYDSVTLDLWAVRIAFKEYSKPAKEITRYMRDWHERDELIQAYHVAAKRLYMQPAILQAVTWVIARDVLSKQDI